MSQMDAHIGWLQNEHGMSYVGTRAVEGEVFAVMESDGVVEYHHPTWSVTGSGPTTLDAEMDLVKNGCEHYKTIMHLSVNDMSRDLLECAFWCARCLVYKTRKIVEGELI